MQGWLDRHRLRKSHARSVDEATAPTGSSVRLAASDQAEVAFRELGSSGDPGPMPCIPLVDVGWLVCWGIVAVSTPWGRVVLLTGLLTLILTILEVMLMVSIMS